MVWEQGNRNSKGQLEIPGGNKGIITFDLSVESADVDIHSKFGGTINSSSWYLINALSSIRDGRGKILVDGIYDDVLEPTEREMDLVRQYALVDEQHLKKVYDLKLPFLTQDQDALLKNLFFEPSINIQGVQTGYQGQGVKTILPAEASAKLEVRLVPGMKPRKVFQQIQDQLIRNGFDQIQWLVNEIKTNPNSRRLIVSGWNPNEAGNVALPPCHTLFQFFVQNGKLSCQLYQRSADVFLGVPFNIASYALLTHMIAQVCGLGVGDFVWTGGDTHLYANHFEQAKLQLSREPMALCQLKLNPEIHDLFDFKFEDIEIAGYESHPGIKAPVAV